MVFAWINFIILIAVSGIHLYWAFGGQIAASAVMPESGGIKLFKPGPAVILIVAFSVAGMAVAHLLYVEVFMSVLPGGLIRVFLFGISGIFLIRAVGEFKYVGFFKRIRDSVFAKMDTRYYSPLCVLISLNAFFTAITDIQ